MNPKKRQAAGSNNSASVLFTKRQICVNKCGFYLPFVITHSLILYLFFMYIFTYLRHLIGQTKFWSSVPSDGDKTRGIVLAVLLGWLVLWLEVSLHRAVFTHPGLVPPNSVRNSPANGRKTLISTMTITRKRKKKRRRKKKKATQPTGRNLPPKAPCTSPPAASNKKRRNPNKKTPTPSLAKLLTSAPCATQSQARSKSLPLSPPTLLVAGLSPYQSTTLT